jgi:hypothetical protein
MLRFLLSSRLEDSILFEVAWQPPPPIPYAGKKIFGFKDPPGHITRAGDLEPSTLLNSTIIFNAFVFCQVSCVFIQTDSQKSFPTSWLQGSGKTSFALHLCMLLYTVSNLAVPHVVRYMTSGAVCA